VNSLHATGRSAHPDNIFRQRNLIFIRNGFQIIFLRLRMNKS
jgi:hypothetical protein